jgi:hypothetical protein
LRELRPTVMREVAPSVAVDSYTLGPLASSVMSLRSLTVLVSMALAFAVAAPAVAQNPNQAFSGRIMLSSKRFPQTAKSPSAYTAAIRKQAQTSFVESKDSRSWKIHLAAFLKTPLNDLEYVVKVYELTNRGQALLMSIDQFTNERGQQTIVSSMTLERKQVGVNKELLITMEHKNKVLASSKFRIVGEGERFTGKVDFSADEVNGKAEDE